MAFYTTSEFKSGLKVIMEGDPYSILENVPVKPGKGQAFNRVKLRNLKTGRVIEMTFKSGEGLPGADVVDVDAQYLYNDGQVWHFMMPDTFDQFEVSEAVVIDAKSWLKEQDTCVLTLWNGVPLVVTPPNQVILKVVDTDPGLRGDTSSGGNKPATMETGVVIRVPLFVQVGDLIKVDTRTGNYISRAKE